MIFINTRPSDRAKPLSECLRQAGMNVLDLPLIAIQPLVLNNNEYNALYHWQEYDVVVVVSPTAAQLLRQHLTNINATAKSHATPTVIAVGQTTAAVLQHQGMNIQIPKVSSNEGMLAMPCIAKLKAGQKALICRGVGGRRLLIDSLSQKGVQVDSISLYQRQLPTPTPIIFEQWAVQQCMQSYHTYNDCKDNPLAMVLVSSGESFTHWQNVCKQLAQKLSRSCYQQSTQRLKPFTQLSNYHYLVLGQRLQLLLTGKKLSVITLTTLDSQHILQQLTSHFLI